MAAPGHDIVGLEAAMLRLDVRESPGGQVVSVIRVGDGKREDWSYQRVVEFLREAVEIREAIGAVRATGFTLAARSAFGVQLTGGSWYRLAATELPVREAAPGGRVGSW